MFFFSEPVPSEVDRSHVYVNFLKEFFFFFSFFWRPFFRQYLFNSRSKMMCRHDFSSVVIQCVCFHRSFKVLSLVVFVVVVVVALFVSSSCDIMNIYVFRGFLAQGQVVTPFSLLQ